MGSWRGNWPCAHLGPCLGVEHQTPHTKHQPPSNKQQTLHIKYQAPHTKQQPLNIKHQAPNNKH